MSLTLRKGHLDVTVLAGPRVPIWPSVGVRTLSAFCTEMGLSVGLFGGPGLSVRGVLPLPGTGAVVITEDTQGRLHRIQVRAVVRVSPTREFPEPFLGWRSPGLIPLSSAQALRQSGEVSWGPVTAILGTGNRALQFGASLLETGAAEEVYCLESHAPWKGKNYNGWEVQKRHFEILGGKILEGQALSLEHKGALTWAFRIKDSLGVRVLEVARVVSAGPFEQIPAVREYPPGSLLFEMDQLAVATKEEDVQGWVSEEEWGRWLGAKIVKALVTDLGDKREDFEKRYKRAKQRLKRYQTHQQEPFAPNYTGKWTHVEDLQKLKAFPGFPVNVQKFRQVAAIECVEEIPCNLCEKACPEMAIQIHRKGGKRSDKEVPPRFLVERDCTACGICLKACPSRIPLLMQEEPEKSLSKMTFPWSAHTKCEVGDFVVLLNRRGEVLGNARIVGFLETGESAEVASIPSSEPAETKLVQIEVPTHLVWEVRGLKPSAKTLREDREVVERQDRFDIEKRVEITLNGEKRLVRPGVSLAVSLFEIGKGRLEDVLLCPDGSCHLCTVMVDGISKLACQTEVHPSMVVKTDLEGSNPTEKDVAASQKEKTLCPCLGLTEANIMERLKSGRLQSPEAVLAVTHVGEGRCRGQLCHENFRRLLSRHEVEATQFIDWRFPWTHWTLKSAP